MTTVDPFTTPPGVERGAHAKQARDFFALAAGAESVATRQWDGQSYRYSYEDGVEAVRDAMVGQGHALMAIHAELADIAGSLRTLAGMPAAVQSLGASITAASQSPKEGLTDLGNDVCDVHTAIEDGAESVAAMVHEVSDTVDRHAGIVDSALFGVVDVIDRPRWWQWRRQRATAVLGEPAVQEESLVEVHEFRVDLRRQGMSWHDDSLASVRFRAQSKLATQVAESALPALCEQADLPVEPNVAYGEVYRCDVLGMALSRVGSVFLPGSVAPPEEF